MGQNLLPSFVIELHNSDSSFYLTVKWKSSLIKTTGLLKNEKIIVDANEFLLSVWVI